MSGFLETLKRDARRVFGQGQTEPSKTPANPTVAETIPDTAAHARAALSQYRAHQQNKKSENLSLGNQLRYRITTGTG